MLSFKVCQAFGRQAEDSYADADADTYSDSDAKADAEVRE